MVHIWWFMGLTILMLAGCQSQQTLFKDDSSHIQTVENTRKGELVSSQTTKALLLATYLNPLKPEKYHTQEYFFIDLFLADSPQKPDLKHSGYTITLQESGGALNVRPLKKDDPLLQQMAIINRWGHHYVTSFPSSDSELLTLVLDSEEYGKTELVFRKEEYTSER